MHQVKAHDLQAFAASKVFQVSLEQILSACHWKFYNTFMQFNLKDVAWPDSDLYHLGPIVAAQQTRTTGCVIGPIFIYLRYSRTPYSTEPLRLAPIELKVLSVNFVKIALSCTVYKMCFCVLHRNSRWPPKMVGKRFLVKNASRLCRYPAGQKFRQNRTILHRLQDVFLRITQKFKMAAKNGGKQFLPKRASRLYRCPLGQKFS